jgi:hypothetical protein
MKIFLLSTFFFLFSCNSKSKKPDNISTPQVVTQSAKHLKHGEELEINVRVEGLNDTLNPRVKIGGIDVPINPVGLTEGLVIYKTRVNGTLGEHTIPVTVTHYTENGKWKTDEYTVNFFIDK